MTAMFVVIFLQQWEKDRTHEAEFIGLGASLLCLLIFGPDRFIVPAMLVILLCLTAGRKKLEPAYSAVAAEGRRTPAEAKSGMREPSRRVVEKEDEAAEPAADMKIKNSGEPMEKEDDNNE